MEKLNEDILRECREQMGLSVSDVEGKVPGIAAVEQGDQGLTFEQLDTLAELYNVPSWVFITGRLPKKYQFKDFLKGFPGSYETRKQAVEIYKILDLVKDARNEVEACVAKIDSIERELKETLLSRYRSSTRPEPPTDYCV